jgi:hypothetical protein
MPLIAMPIQEIFDALFKTNAAKPNLATIPVFMFVFPCLFPYFRNMSQKLAIQLY